MQDIITSFLVQNKECSLPGIGKFRIITTPAELDIANQQMLPPKDEILFTGKPDKNVEELIRFIAFKNEIKVPEAEELLKKWCQSVHEKLDAGGKIFFETIGSLQKKESGNIFLYNEETLSFFEPIPAVRVIHQNEEHSVLVGDKETTSSEMNEFFREEESIKKSGWKIIAIILLVITLSVLFFHFYSHSFSLSATGNQTHHAPKGPAATYLPQ
ncbi:MAG: hypothetical protein Q8891_16180 [Bacteroidota bacterium]|jgi:nucleoid DNA-binding protein|nr:hypothetical protein [Bacteroidota bacterium]